MKSKIMKGKALFIAIDGVDGSGKGTQVKKLVGYIFDRDKSNHPLMTREPFRSKYMAKIRQILKDGKDPKKLGHLLTRLFVADRRVHAWVIKKLLELGIHVISDRYKYSTLAYQQAQGMDLKKLIRMHKGILVPDLVIILDIPVVAALKRIAADIQSGNRHKEVFEQKAFQEQLRKNFLALPRQLPKERIVIVNGNQTVDKVFEAIKKEANKVL